MSAPQLPYGSAERVVVGIDPGVETSVAVWSVDRAGLRLSRSGTFWTAWDVVSALCSPAGSSSSGARYAVVEVWLASPAGQVGESRDVVVWSEWLAREGYRVRRVAPRRASTWGSGRVSGLRAWSSSPPEVPR